MTQNIAAKNRLWSVLIAGRDARLKRFCTPVKAGIEIMFTPNSK
jgi:hypothetical protein